MARLAFTTSHEYHVWSVACVMPCRILGFLLSGGPDQACASGGEVRHGRNQCGQVRLPIILKMAAHSLERARRE